MLEYLDYPSSRPEEAREAGPAGVNRAIVSAGERSMAHGLPVQLHDFAPDARKDQTGCSALGAITFDLWRLTR